MAKIYLTGADRQKLQNVIDIVGGGSGNNRPIARRRRQVVSEGASGGGTQTALLTASLPAGVVDATEKTVALEATTTEVVTLLTLGVTDLDVIQLVPRTKDDPSAPEPAEGQPETGRQLTGDRLHGDDELWGENPAGGRSGSAPPGPPGPPRRSAFATSTRSGPAGRAGGRSRCSPGRRRPRARSEPGRHHETVPHSDGSWTPGQLAQQATAR